MIGNIALGLYISFVVGFVTFYIFVRYSEWGWLQKIFNAVIATLVYAIFLPVMCGVYMGLKYVKLLELNKKLD